MTNEHFYDPDDIVYKTGAARMFGCEGEPQQITSSINYLMKIKAIPPYDGYAGSRGYWRRGTLRTAREFWLKHGTTQRKPPTRKAGVAS